MAKGKAKKAKETPTHEELTEEIRKEAQKVYEKRIAKQVHGDEMSDWLAAEQKVYKKHDIKWYTKS